jgi:hypothetical protein
VQALVEEGHLLEPRADRLEVVRDVVSKMSSGLAQNVIVVPVWSVASGFHLGQRVRRARRASNAIRKTWPFWRTSTSIRRGQRVDHRGADAVQAAGDLVAAAAELAARVQLGEHELDGRTPPVGWMSTGMPRPLSTTRTPPSAQERDVDAVSA